MRVFKENGKNQKPAFRTDHWEMKEKRAIFYSAWTERFLFSRQNKRTVAVCYRRWWESVGQRRLCI